MRVILYISMSLDGYIADKHGQVSWIMGNDPTYDGDVGYQAFIKNIDTIVMGRKTYQQITEELSPDVWVYPDQITYVITHHPKKDTKQVRFTQENPQALIQRLKKEAAKDIWICGGASVIEPLIKSHLIDEYQICIVPQVLGNGIALFNDFPVSLKLTHVQEENGFILCTYLPKEVCTQ